MTTPEGSRSVGRYRILGFLGSGAMGEVYLAEDPHIERKLAIKTVRLVGRPDEVQDRKKRLLREARAAGRLLHPNVVTLFDAGEADGQLYLAFEFVEGTDLAGRIQAGPPLTLREVLRIVRQVAEALDYAHRQGIVHRDIKPSNILLDPAGRVKVADFGIAKVTGQSTELTMAGSVMGSPQYLSPEQIRGDDLDGRSDIFSLGVVLYELLSKKRPFDGETITTLVYQILHKEPPPVSSLHSVPSRLEQLLRGMLAKDRDQRIATAGQVAEELAAIERDLDDETLSAPAARAAELAPTHVLPRSTGSAVPAATTRQSAPPPVRPATGKTVVATDGISPKRWVPLVAAVVLIAAVAAGWLVLRKPEPQPVNQVATSPTQPSPTMAPSPTPAVASPAVPVAPPEPRPQETTLPEPTPRRLVQPTVTPGLPAPTRPAPTPEPERPRIEIQREPTPAPAPAPPPVEEEQEAPAAAADLRTGLAVVFRVNPPDAFVRVDRTVIGRAREWSGQKGARTYTLEPGLHDIVIRADGMKEHRITVEASETGGITPIIARLSPLPAAQVETGDLRVFRVSEAVAFRVRPPGAAILVNGQPAGRAGEYAGGLRPASWLKLPPGKHRISIVARGHRRQDVIVEVVPGAPRERERIEVDLLAGGDD